MMMVWQRQCKIGGASPDEGRRRKGERGAYAMVADKNIAILKDANTALSLFSAVLFDCAKPATRLQFNSRNFCPYQPFKMFFMSV